MTTPRWSARAYTEADRDTVLDLFTEPDFYYRTTVPDTRPAWEVLDLVGSDTRVLSADGRPVGLYALADQGSEHACHYLLSLRLRAAAPLAWWTSAYGEIVRAQRWRREVVRLSMQVPEFDDRGRAAALACGLTEEGTLAEVTVRDGRRWGTVYFAQIWVPTP